MLRLPPVPETMLWTLHNRASEAERADAILSDPAAIRIRDAIEFPFAETFGPPNAIHAFRSLTFDKAIRDFLARHPDGVIVNLGEGLETQTVRLADLGTSWYSVDVPEAMEIRERFLPPDGTHHHLAHSAFDPQWMNEVPDDRPALVTAQGLFMYFEEEAVARLIAGISERFRGGELWFDFIPPEFSRRSLDGWALTSNYRVPAMPWGVSAREAVDFVRARISSACSVQLAPYAEIPRGRRADVRPIWQVDLEERRSVPTLLKVEL